MFHDLRNYFSVIYVDDKDQKIGIKECLKRS